MTTLPTSAREYLQQKGIEFQERNGEIIARCVFNDCDKDSRPNEAHLYIHPDTGQYDCKKCGEKGNLITLAKHFGDDLAKPATQPKVKKMKFDSSLVERCHSAMPERIREYLHGRGITDQIIAEYELGFGEFYGRHWITIPIKDETGDYAFFKLRQDPSEGSEKITYPKGTHAQLYDYDALDSAQGPLVICEGELDRLLLASRGVKAVTGTHGAATFKREWVDKVAAFQKIYIIYDRDDAGTKGAERVAKLLDEARVPEIYVVTLPDAVGDGGDVTDYFMKHNGLQDDLFGQYAKPYPDKINPSQFKPMAASDIKEVLGLTIKRDEVNKVVTFQCMLSAYTETNQFNISFNAPSSTGKSYIPLEISTLFPTADMLKLGNCSPTAFFHERGVYDKEKNTITVDLSRRIIVFMDMPNNDLLQRLRSLLSHDEKSIESKITDKNQKGGNRTKTVVIKGFPSVIFCSAGLKIDEQEGTRFILLSPETTQDKLREGIQQRILKEADEQAFRDWLNADPGRQLLKLRIQAIRQEKIEDIIVTDDAKETINQYFFEGKSILKPRHQRDIGRLMGLTKTFALLNVWFRERKGKTLYATMDDAVEAISVWDKIAESQEHNLPPYVYEVYKDVILPAWQEKNEDKLPHEPWVGLSQQEVMKKHFKSRGTLLPEWQLRQQVLTMLETAGLITKEQDENDKRRTLICPTVPPTEPDGSENNSESEGGVAENRPE